MVTKFRESLILTCTFNYLKFRLCCTIKILSKGCIYCPTTVLNTVSIVRLSPADETKDKAWGTVTPSKVTS